MVNFWTRLKVKHMATALPVAGPTIALVVNILAGFKVGDIASARPVVRPAIVRFGYSLLIVFYAVGSF